MIVSASSYLDYGALGASMFVLLIAMTVLFRVLAWSRSLMETVLLRLEHNTAALVRLSERLHDDDSTSDVTTGSAGKP